jgi:hypothetical protein
METFAQPITWNLIASPMVQIDVSTESLRNKAFLSLYIYRKNEMASLGVHTPMFNIPHIQGDKGIDNRARQLSTPEVRLARPNCNTSRNTSSCRMSIL